MSKELNVQDVIRHLVVHDPSISVNEIIKNLERAGLDHPTKYYVSTFRRLFLDTLQFLRHEGLLLEPQKLPPSKMARPKRVPQPKVAKKRKLSKPSHRFLQSYLEEHGEAWAHEVLAAAEGAGISQDQIRRARERLGVVTRKMGLDGWKWKLP